MTSRSRARTGRTCIAPFLAHHRPRPVHLVRPRCRRAGRHGCGRRGSADGAAPVSVRVQPAGHSGVRRTWPGRSCLPAVPFAAFALVLWAGTRISGRAAAAAGICSVSASEQRPGPAVRPGAVARAAIDAPPLAVHGRDRRYHWATVRLDAAHRRHTGQQAHPAGQDHDGLPPADRELGLGRGVGDTPPDEAVDHPGSVVGQRRFDRHETRYRRRAARGVVVAGRPPARCRDRHHDRAAGDHASIRRAVPARQAPSSIAYPTRLSLPLQIVLGAYAANV